MAIDSSTAPKGRPILSMRLRKFIVPTIAALAFITFISNGTKGARRFLSEIRYLCETTFKFGKWPDRPETFWEQLYSQDVIYTDQGDKFPDYDPMNIGYALAITSCPEDKYNPVVDVQHDPGHSFYDAASVLKYSVCRHKLGYGPSKYNATFYAFVHPDAIRCVGPDGEEYDRVKVLIDQGYHIIIHDNPVFKSEVKQSVEQKVDSDVGIRDMMKLWAYKLDHHPAVVMMDFTTLALDSMDTTLDHFIADPSAEIMYSTDYAKGVNTGWTIIKPGQDKLDAILDAYKTTDFDPNHGWNQQGVGLYPGGLGCKGFLEHYYTRVQLGKARGFDRCYFNNDASNPMTTDSRGNSVCRDPNACDNCQTTDINSVKVLQMITICGASWECYYDDSWDPATKAICDDFHRSWYSARIQFEASAWHNGPPSDRSGTYKPDVFLGFCHSAGKLGYDRMIDDKGPGCDPDTYTSEQESLITWNGKYQFQKLSLTTGQKTGTTKACVSGSVTKNDFEPPLNIAVVIDVSGSTRTNFEGSPVGDVNLDGQADTILDAEIASVMKVLEYISESSELGNDNVDIGLIKFSTHAEYVGHYPPSDPSDASQPNPELKDLLLGLRSGGFTHFDDALDKAIDYFQNDAPPNRPNMMFFLSDGIPNVQGDGDLEEPISNTYSNNHKSALMYDSEIATMDQLNVQRHAIGVGSGSDVRDGFGLDMIDNTPDLITGEKAIQVTTTDALTDTLLSNPLVGEVVDFSIAVNGVVRPGIDKNSVASGFTGFTFGEFIVDGLSPFGGKVNTIDAAITVDVDGDTATTNDQHIIATTNYVVGSLF